MTSPHPSGGRGSMAGSCPRSLQPSLLPSTSRSTPRRTAAAAPLRADRGRRRARRRRRAARALRLARPHRAAALARHPALHRDHPGDGVVGAAGRGGAAASWPSCSRGACWSRTTPASTVASCARRSSASASTWPRPPVICTVAMARRFAPLVRERKLASLAELARHRGRRGAPRAARRHHLRARVLRAVPALCATRADDRGGARLAAAAPPRAQARAARAGIAAEERPDLSDAARRPRRLHLPQRARAAAVRRQVGVAALARPRALLRARRAGPSARRSWTTGPRTRSWARWCSRTG